MLNQDGFTCVEGGYTIQYHLDNPKTYQIHSVKRLSDNKVFSIGDSICFTWYRAFDVRQLIQKIVIEDGQIMLYYGENSKYDLMYARLNPKHKQQPLFITEDNKPIYDNSETLWRVNKEFDIYSLLASEAYVCRDDYKHFSTKEAAEKFVVENKPVFSYNDLKHLAYPHPENGPLIIHQAALKQFIKTKL